jgi:hypothetical protein
VGEAGRLFEEVEEGKEFAAAEGGSLEQRGEGERAVLCLRQKGEDITENFRV